jgi:protein arginine N-methyltransferase 3
MSGSDSDYTDDGGDQWEGWNEADTTPVQDIYSADVVYPDAPAFFTATKQKYGIDVLAFFAKLRLDMYDRIRCTNVLRRAAASGVAAADLLAHVSSSAPEWRGSDEALAPALESDGLIQYITWACDSDNDEFEGDEQSASAAAAATDEDDAVVPASALRASDKEARALRIQVAELRDVVARMTTTLQDFAQHASSAAAPTAADATTPEGDTPAAAPASAATDLGASVAPRPRDDVRANDAQYFGGYSRRDIHEVMLKDTHRTESYRDAMLARAEELFKDKVVLDVGCGSGILTMFAARAGARLCIGVDAADIIDKTRTIVAANGFSDRVKLVKGKVEEVTLPEGITAVDIIVSEWMGYFLLYESMLPSVLYARDKWLRRADGASAYAHALKLAPGAAYDAARTSEYTTAPFAASSFLFPDSSRMFVAGVDTRAYRAERQTFWRNVYGFDMSVLMTPEEAFPGESVDTLDAGAACRVTSEEGLQAFDLQSVTSPELDFTARVTLTAEKADTVEAFAVWFDTIFSSARRRAAGSDPASPAHRGPAPGEGDFASAEAVRAGDGSVVLDTSFTRAPTHWKQSIFRLSRVLKVSPGDKIELVLKATRRSSNHRHYNVEVFYTLVAGPAHVAPAASEAVDMLNAEWGVAGVEYQQNYSLQ